jgi:hypothetical protein
MAFDIELVEKRYICRTINSNKYEYYFTSGSTERVEAFP